MMCGVGSWRRSGQWWSVTPWWCWSPSTCTSSEVCLRYSDRSWACQRKGEFLWPKFVLDIYMFMYMNSVWTVWQAWLFLFIIIWLFSLRDLGLERYDTVELFARILLPAAFLLACILQLHYFNSDFLTLTDLDNVPVRQAPRWDGKNMCRQRKNMLL